MVRMIPNPEFELSRVEYKGHYNLTDSRYRKGNKMPIPAKRNMIAWDGEGINLSGMGLPQHYVLFGSSADPDNPLVINGPMDSLCFEELADYILSIAKRFPYHWHVGYFFGYDQNMIIRSLPWAIKERIKETNSALVTGRNGRKYRIQYIPGKTITITRYKHGYFSERKNRVDQSVTIEDMGTFFATSFMKAYTDLFPERVGTPEYIVIEEGKKARGGDSYSDMDTIRYYWQTEIMAMRDLAERFRDLLWDENFELKKWSGPGSFAMLLRGMFKLVQHEWGGKEDNLPLGVHEAAKASFFGGRFEQFQIGRFTKTVYGIDRNSAYPDAFCNVPSLRKGGSWVYVTEPSSDNAFGIFHVRFRADEAGPIKIHNDDGSPYRVNNPPVRRAMPFPFRTKIDTIKYPVAVDGWYHTPEVTVAKRFFGDRVQILEGWEWIAADEDEYPWRDLMTYLFSKRLELKAVKNPAQMAYKLGMNCLYGKCAQRIGWKHNNAAPKSHTLVIAGYITSYVRARMFEIMAQIPDDDLIAVETDGIYTTTDPSTLDIPSGLGKQLGQWGVDKYDECMYIQNGFYIMRENGEWKAPKTRGFSQELVTPAILTEYLQSLSPDKLWQPFHLESGQRFMGLGTSFVRSSGSIAKATMLHCSWFEQAREIDPNGKGKRKHVQNTCPECRAGKTPYDSAHPLYISRLPRNGIKWDETTDTITEEYEVEGYPLSKSYLLPWEKDYKEPSWVFADEEMGIAAMAQYEMAGEVNK